MLNFGEKAAFLKKRLKKIKKMQKKVLTERKVNGIISLALGQTPPTNK